MARPKKGQRRDNQIHINLWIDRNQRNLDALNQVDGLMEKYGLRRDEVWVESLILAIENGLPGAEIARREIEEKSATVQRLAAIEEQISRLASMIESGGFAPAASTTIQQIRSDFDDVSDEFEMNYTRLDDDD